MTDAKAGPTPRTDERVVAHVDYLTVGSYKRMVELARDLETALAAATARAEELADWDVRTFWDDAQRLGLSISHEDGWTLMRTENSDRLCEQADRLAALEAALGELVRLRDLQEAECWPDVARDRMAWEAARKLVSALPDAGKGKRT